MSSEEERLNDINNERVETTKKRVAHAFKLAETAVRVFKYRAKDTETASAINNYCVAIAHASNILEAAEEEMRWACEHFNWNDEICDQINEAVRNFGSSLAFGIQFDPESDDPDEIVFGSEDGLIALSKSLATLIRWFDDEADVSEI